jgi:endonuclease III
LFCSGRALPDVQGFFISAKTICRPNEFILQMNAKEPLDIDRMVLLLREMTAPLPPAALFDLWEQGYTSLFEQLLACLISIRTFDEVTTPVALKLFARARTPAELLTLDVESLTALISESSYARSKAETMLAIARQTLDEFGRDLPADFEVLTSFKGVGPKCAGLALGIAAQQPYIGVDIHVHRVTNRWSYVAQPTPEKTLMELQQKLPEKYWVEINKLLVPFGKHICTGRLPRCSSCLLLPMCRQVGVEKHR